MKRVSLLALIFFDLSTFTFLFAQEQENYKKHPGHLDLSFVEKYGEPKSSVELFLTPGLAKLLGGLDDDEEFENMLKKLYLNKSYTFELDLKNKAEIGSKMKELSASLQKKKWLRFVNIKERDSSSQIFLKEAEDEIQGMVILSVSKDEATFVNIVGTIDLEAMGKLGRRFDIPELDSLNRKK